VVRQTKARTEDDLPSAEDTVQSMAIGGERETIPRAKMCGTKRSKTIIIQHFGEVGEGGVSRGDRLWSVNDTKDMRALAGRTLRVMI
jgi:hypothetical protein